MSEDYEWNIDGTLSIIGKDGEGNAVFTTIDRAALVSALCDHPKGTSFFINDVMKSVRDSIDFKGTFGSDPMALAKTLGDVQQMRSRVESESSFTPETLLGNGLLEYERKNQQNNTNSGSVLKGRLFMTGTPARV